MTNQRPRNETINSLNPIVGVFRTSKQTWLSEFDQNIFMTGGNNSRFGIGPYLTREKLETCTRDHVAMQVSDRIMRATATYVRATGTNMSTGLNVS